VLKGGENMLFAVIGSSAGKTGDEIMAIYPRHKAFLEQFLTRGEVVGVGPFTDPGGGNMALFRSRAAAEAFAKSDPFFLEGAEGVSDQGVGRYYAFLSSFSLQMEWYQA
jgi:uncharacterized protein